tara:strand:+ start:401 stop:1474 length:1074 start_codon:yes stop_codon:yes gene_type:complete
MHLGYFTFPVHPKKKSLKICYKEDQDAIILGELNGFNEAFVGEHCTDEYERITSSLLFIATLIDKTSKIKLGTGTINLPNTHPVTVANNFAMIDHMSNGRLILGIGPGSLVSDMEAYGNLEKNRPEMFLESIDQILKIWKKKPPYNIKGKYWNITTKKTYDKNISIGSFLQPYQRPRPEIVCTSLSRNLNSITGLTKKGWNLISSNFLHNESLKYHYEGINNARLNDKKKLNWRIARKIFVNDNKKKVNNYVFSNNSPYYLTVAQVLKKLKKYNRLDVVKKNPLDKKEKICIDKLMKDLILCGDSKVVADKILSLRHEVGSFNTISYVGIDWKDTNLAKNSMRLMGTKVMEIINKNT